MIRGWLHLLYKRKTQYVLRNACIMRVEWMETTWTCNVSATIKF